MENITQLINSLWEYILNSINSFGPQNGEWSSTLVTIGTGIVLLIGWIYTEFVRLREMKKDRVNEELQTFLQLRESYKRDWENLTKVKKNILYIDYCNNEQLRTFFKNEDEEEAYRSQIFSLFLTLSDVILAYNHRMKSSEYWHEWEAIFHHVFSKPLFRTAFIKHRKQFQIGRPKGKQYFVKYVDSLIKRITPKKMMSPLVKKKNVEDPIEPPPIPKNLNQLAKITHLSDRRKKAS